MNLAQDSHRDERRIVLWLHLLLAAVAAVLGLVASLFIRPLAAQVVVGVVVAAIVFGVFEARWARDGRKFRGLYEGITVGADGTVTVDGGIAGRVRCDSEGRWHGHLDTGSDLPPCDGQSLAVLALAAQYRQRRDGRVSQ